MNYVQVSQLFLSKIVLGEEWNWSMNFKKAHNFQYLQTQMIWLPANIKHL